MSTSDARRQSRLAGVRVRPYEPVDYEFVMSLAPRLLVGAAPWIDPERMLEAARQWITGSIDRHGSETMVFVAVDVVGARLGFASVSRGSHFTEVPLAYIGELAVDEAAEGQGVGKALVGACEHWARQQGCLQVALDTGFANDGARRFYERLGFKEESVKLVHVFE